MVCIIYQSSLSCNSLIYSIIEFRVLALDIWIQLVFISVFIYDRYDSYFRTDPQNDKFVPGIINVYNPGQNIWIKVKKSSKIGDDQKTLKSVFVYFLNDVTKKNFLEGRLLTSFEIYLKFSCFLSLELLGDSSFGIVI